MVIMIEKIPSEMVPRLLLSLHKVLSFLRLQIQTPGERSNFEFVGAIHPEMVGMLKVPGYYSATQLKDYDIALFCQRNNMAGKQRKVFMIALPAR